MTGILELRDLAAAVAAKTSTFLLDEVQKGHRADTKSSLTDMVTAADRAAEELIVEAIMSVRPNDGFKGEEGTDVAGSSGVRWVIDPIDGTANFVVAHPGYAVSIAAEADGRIVAGAVADPAHSQLFDAALGHGARCNTTRLNIRPDITLAQSLVATGFSFDADRRRQQADALTVILSEIADIRRMGSAALDLCGVALGRVHAYYELWLNEWDLAAGALVAAEAGAVVTMPHSAQVPGPFIVAAVPAIADSLSALLARAGLQ